MSDGVAQMVMSNAFSPVASPAQAEKYNAEIEAAPIAFRPRKSASHAHNRLESVVEMKEEEGHSSPNLEDPKPKEKATPPPLKLDGSKPTLTPIVSGLGLGGRLRDLGEQRRHILGTSKLEALTDSFVRSLPPTLTIFLTLEIQPFIKQRCSRRRR